MTKKENLKLMEVPIVSDTYPVVLYLGSEEDREELIQVLMKIIPDMRSRKLPNVKTKEG